ncbi:SAM-dependent methyltransferase [Streptomyces sp. NPDC017890]|uniref:SAM-dependent methyltransferase n=1 Tax=Streptomyces sp. NPDC017890 TaxID=3365015 RepID=UPI0037B069E0
MQTSPCQGSGSEAEAGTSPSSARIWDHWLGGGHNLAVDRGKGDRLAAEHPGLVERVRGTREFVRRAVSRLVADEGIRQFLDIGSGLPTAGSTHEIARRTAPGTRVVYVDNDPRTVHHAGTILTPASESVTCLLGDLREPGAVLAAAARTLDLSCPVGLVLGGVLGHVPTHEEACDIVRRLMSALPRGSHLVAVDVSDTDGNWRAVQARRNATTSFPYRLRTPGEIAEYFDGLDVLAPGVVPVTDWLRAPHRVPRAEPADLAADVVGGIGRKP